jgi:hypothetical protein
VKRRLVFISLAASGLAHPAITQGWREAGIERAVAANAEAVLFRSPVSPSLAIPRAT